MRLLDPIELDQFVFFDIETAPAASALEEVPGTLRDLWLDREARAMARAAGKSGEEVDPRVWFAEHAGLQAEFGRVVCIAVGFFNRSREGLKLRVKTIAYPEEEYILEDFANLLDKSFADPGRFRLCGHNIRGFDLPYLSRRLMIRGKKLPALLDTAGFKPWELPHVDTLDLWRFGEYRHFVSLKLLAGLFGLPSPKDDIAGADVGRVFWEENDLDRICVYCAKDVRTVAELVLVWKGEKKLADDQVVVV